ncbi:DUF5522 domain-containing protein [Emticicia sp.]|uniref:DUF5522 domain-containing protein n=1 Tax=Emticicia sp. TaxID=1930953 RepID=UPI0037506008
MRIRKNKNHKTPLPNLNADGSQSESNDSEDYYYEKGFMIFTATYHLKRGYCCKNACRHCPYGFKKN